nr:MAG TPA: hypothetical protein [Caudoviricetes sp.]
MVKSYIKSILYSVADISRMEGGRDIGRFIYTKKTLLCNWKGYIIASSTVIMTDDRFP